MSTTLQADEKGNLQLHSSLLPKPDPHATYNIREQNGSLLTSRETIDTPENEPSWKTATPEERARAFEERVKELPPGPGLSDYAVSRESTYD